MSGSPSNRCVLFADIVGSSRLYERLGDAEAHHAVERCLNRMERAAVACKGRVIKTLGDELMVAFDSAEAAMHAADEMQQRIHALPPVSGMVLAIRVGFHQGPVLDQNGDLVGDAVNTASHLASLAKAGQTLTTAETVDGLPADLRSRTHSLGALAVEGKNVTVRAFEATWSQSDDEVTMKVTRPVAATPVETRLWLRHGGQDVILGPDRPTAWLGRDVNSDIVIHDSRASRSHGRIEYRCDQYVLVDQSTNGTYVSISGESEFVLKREETILRGRGHIYFGHAAAGGDGGEMLEFEILG
ncbi:MAG TPA: adenylate/guanylate cyclase domain-containing protein [Rhodocyclaceae bacterium]|nr:adenylate/guanylate cyclase domain-containing protein [Rhodocyclaceae bacterium]